MKKFFFAPIALLSAVAVSGCMPSDTGSSFGRFTSISIVDSSERIKLDTKISLSDIIAFAENMTNQMLQSPIFTKAKKPPRVIVTAIRNNTHDENLRVSDIYDRISSVLVKSGKVRVLDESALNFNYVMHVELTDIVTRSPDGQKLVEYTMKIKLYDLYGELKDQWADDLSLFKNR
ncbi:MAG: hypothetical protein IJN87_04900 [Firmicutes bacterium]|nr:hypothetical protein [Bacillota bacterium]MBR3690680.1 hypothetical protein [Eggerthellaceae bacterium]